MMRIGSFRQEVSVSLLIFFYSATLIIVGLLFYIQKSAELVGYISPIDKIGNF